MWVVFANAKATHIFFSKNISIYAIFNDQNFKDTLTNNIVSFEPLGPDEKSDLSGAFYNMEESKFSQDVIFLM